MRKSKKLILIFSIASILMLVIICSFISFLAWLYEPNVVLRELRQEEIRPMLKRITGRELPGKVEDLRAILYSRAAGGLEDIFVSFQTDQQGFLYTLDAFGGQDVKMEEFPQVGKNPFRWIRAGFDEGYRFQKKLGVVLFDKDLLDRIIHDALEHDNTGRFPKDAVTGYYLEFNDSSKLVNYNVLVFEDLGVVYISAEKMQEDIHLR